MGALKTRFESLGWFDNAKDPKKKHFEIRAEIAGVDIARSRLGTTQESFEALMIAIKAKLGMPLDKRLCEAYGVPLETPAKDIGDLILVAWDEQRDAATERLARQRHDGAITDEEYDDQFAEVINRHLDAYPNAFIRAMAAAEAYGWQQAIVAARQGLGLTKPAATF